MFSHIHTDVYGPHTTLPENTFHMGTVVSRGGTESNMGVRSQHVLGTVQVCRLMARIVTDNSPGGSALGELSALVLF